MLQEPKPSAIAILYVASLQTITSKSFAKALKKRYQVLLVASGKEAFEILQGQPPHKQPHIIIVDAVSMRTTGLRICNNLRNVADEIPMIHIHPPTQEKVVSPADVVLFPTFTARKLTNNIQRLLTSLQDDVIECGAFCLNRESRILTFYEQEIQMTPKSAGLMEIFLRTPNTTFSRESLMQQVWKTDYMGDTRTLDVHIRWIRKALGKSISKQHLKTVRGIGYRFEVELI